VPGLTNKVTFDGEGIGACTLDYEAKMDELIFNDSAASPNGIFDQAGYDMTCSTFAFDWNTGTGDFFDGEITVRGLTFTVTAATNATVFASATINCTGAGGCTVASAVALPQITAAYDFTTTAALTVARLINAGTGTFTFKEGVDFTLTAYTSTAPTGDWDNLTEIVSSAGATWGFVNPASMVLRNIPNIEDMNATNPINAVDACGDGTGNTNLQVKLFWVGDSGGAWEDVTKWSLSSNGAAEGNVWPTALNDVTFDGGGTAPCTLDAAAVCRDLVFDDSVAQPENAFNAAGFAVTCRTFVMDWNTGDTIVFDGILTITGDTFTVTASTNASFFASGTIVLSADCTVASDKALPHITANGAFTTGAALAVAQLVAPAQALTFKSGVAFTLTTYDATDWDGCTIVSDDSGTWGFVNPAAMVVVGINVQDSNASNEIDATDTCTDGTGNTNWTFV